MPVFDSDGITVLANQDPGTDNSLPPPRWLNYAAMASDGALRNTKGIDCKVVHGRREQHIYGPMNEWVDNDLNSTIGGNETRNVGGGFTESVTGVYTLTVTGGWQEEQRGAVNRHYFQKVADTFDNDHHVDQPDSAAFSATQYSNSFVRREQISIVGDFQLQMTLLLGLTIAPVLDGEYKTLHAEFHLLHGDGKLVKLYEIGQDAGATANDTHVKTQTAVRASCNAGVDVDCGFPPT